MNEEKVSALRAILDQIYTAPDREAALKILTDYLGLPDCGIPPGQRRTMLIFANRCQTMTSLQKYVTNSFLYYEGNGVKNPAKRGSFYS